MRGTDSIFIYNSTFCPHSVFMCFVWIWEQTAIISLYSINMFVCPRTVDALHFPRGTNWTYKHYLNELKLQDVKWRNERCADLIPTFARQERQSLYVQRNIQTRSSDHCSRGKAIRITCSECVFVTLVIQHAKRMRCVMSLGVACPALPFLSTLFLFYHMSDQPI